jgi:hypothetical protein
VRLKQGEWFYWSVTGWICPHDVRDDILWDTIGQYTGVKDQNGTEIWEGDLIQQTPNGRAFTVAWGLDQYELHTANGQFYSPLTPGGDCVVVGHIHENAEILKEL